MTMRRTKYNDVDVFEEWISTLSYMINSGDRMEIILRTSQENKNSFAEMLKEKMKKDSPFIIKEDYDEDNKHIVCYSNSKVTISVVDENSRLITY